MKPGGDGKEEEEQEGREALQQQLREANHQAAEYRSRLLKKEQEADLYRQKLATMSQQEASTGEGPAQEELSGADTVKVSLEETGGSCPTQPPRRSLPNPQVVVLPPLIKKATKVLPQENLRRGGYGSRFWRLPLTNPLMGSFWGLEAPRRLSSVQHRPLRQAKDFSVLLGRSSCRHCLGKALCLGAVLGCRKRGQSPGKTPKSVESQQQPRNLASPDRARNVVQVPHSCSALREWGSTSPHPK
ncbi:hypothetical protein E2320_014071 [Naja naja]|nr:hypothetical protein E2320_014071 [Naja naja]